MLPKNHLQVRALIAQSKQEIERLCIVWPMLDH
jgi:hypothetical protein